MIFRWGESVRLWLVILCSAYAVVPPGLCVCPAVESRHQPAEVPQPPTSRSCCRHAHHSTATDTHPPAERHHHHRPADHHPHHCHVCERLPATVPTAERWDCPDMPGNFVTPPPVRSAGRPDLVEVTPTDPQGSPPRLRLYVLCSLRM